MSLVHKSGARKRAIARATLKPGNGIIRVNGKLLEFMTPELYKIKIQEPLLIAGELSKKVDISIKIQGGGMAAQAEAARLAIGRALVGFDSGLEKAFLEYDRSMLVADVRRKETHKPNHHGKARARRQRSRR